jgi:hypothetical protein
MVSMTQRNFVLLVVGVCILSAGIGSGLALLAQTGPAGPKGARGAKGERGPRGPEGESAAGEVEGLEAEVEELRGRVEEGEELNGRVEALEEELGGLSEGGAARSSAKNLASTAEPGPDFARIRGR